MLLAKMRSINEALTLVKEIDVETAITYNCIKKLCIENKIRYFRSGKKIILNYDDLLQFIGILEGD